MTAYVNAVVSEAHDRDHDNIRSVEAYFMLRRETTAGLPALFPNEMAVDAPDEVMEHPTLLALKLMYADCMYLTNVSCVFEVN